MIRVSQLKIKNIGPFKEQVFDLSVEKGYPDIHIFTGTNGSGKTTILHAIASEFDYFEKEHKEHVSNFFYKRFHFFERDNRGLPKSYAHVILENKKNKKGSIFSKNKTKSSNNYKKLNKLFIMDFN